ncbi:MAG: hypothetical protein Q4G35_04825 [Propionibacteriaceae bacterium]|nr:hypothetical protein [Propionibacteriaceae bacterium]
MSPVTFHTPPNWPPCPPGWVPGADWRPDPLWGPAPAGWAFYRGPYGEPSAPPPGAWQPVATVGPPSVEMYPSPEVGEPSGRSRTWLYVTVAVVLAALMGAGVVIAAMRGTAEKANPDPISTTAPAVEPSPAPPSVDVSPEPVRSPAAEPTQATTEPAAVETSAPAPAETTTAAPLPPPSETPKPAEPEPDPIEQPWIDVDAYISGPAQLSALDGGPKGFKTYIGEWAGDVDDDGCVAEFGVYAMHPTGFAVGTAGWTNCGGGANVIWSSKSGQWEPLFVLQDLPTCYDLWDAGVPPNSGRLECYDGEGTYWW